MTLIFFSPLLIGIALIIFLVVHHGMTHMKENGEAKLFDTHDFKNSVFTLLSSHEGWIIIILLVMLGYVIGGM